MCVCFLQLEHSALPSQDPPGTLADNIPSPYSGLTAGDTQLVLEGLSPNTNYTVTLCAYTSSGCGVPTTAINQTNEDGERAHPQFLSRFKNCFLCSTIVCHKVGNPIYQSTWFRPRGSAGDCMETSNHSQRIIHDSVHLLWFSDPKLPSSEERL